MRNSIWAAFLLFSVIIVLTILHQPLLTALGHIVVYHRYHFDQVGAVIVSSGVVPDRVCLGGGLFAAVERG